MGKDRDDDWEDREERIRDGLLDAGYAGPDMADAMEDFKRRWEKED